MSVKSNVVRHVAAAALFAAAIGFAPPSFAEQTKGNYAQVGPLKTYYEVHGTGGTPLVLLHGGLCTIESCLASIIPALAKNRRVIAIEQQAHGRTADIDRPLSYEQMAEDTAALLRQIGVQNADIFGYSMGGAIALRLGMKHPALVRRLVILSSAVDKEAWEPAILEGMAKLTPESIPPMFRDAYAKVAPDPTKWTALVGKIKALATEFKGWSADEVRTIKAPTLFVLGDRDIIRLEGAVALFRLLPAAQLGVLPGTDHFALATHPDWVLAMTTAFLDAPAK